MKRLDTHSKYKDAYKRKQAREEEQRQKEVEEEQKKINEKLQNAIFGKFKLPGANQTQEADKTKEIEKSVKQEDGKKEKKAIPKTLPMVSRRLRAR